MKKIFLVVLIFFMGQFCNAQKQVDKLIDNDDRKKLIQARKLFNEFKIFEAEKIIKELIKKNPKQVYFYEALVQVQKQVLERITNASGELQQINLSKAAIDSINSEISADEEDNPIAETNTNTANDTREVMESLGLDMVKINMSDEPKKEKKKDSQEDEEEEIITEATVTIDSTLIFSEEERNEFSKQQISSEKKIDKKTKRKLKIIENFASIPYSAYLNDLIQNARNATRIFPNADSASLYLRQYLLDTINVNAEVKKEAWDEYVAGLDDYYDKMIPAAAQRIEKALAIDDIFYSAHLRLGDIYYLMNNDTGAVLQYRYAAVLEPENPTPFEKLAIMLYNRGMYQEAAATIIEAIMKYPHAHLFGLLDRIMEKTGRELDRQWVIREVFPLKTTNMYEEIVVDDKSPWWHYQAARQDVFNYFDTLGVVIPNDKTQERYLEVYAWKKMLNNSSPKNFLFARAMEKIGYLDCYVLISLFHHDLYSQFTDLVKSNPDKIKKYFYILLNWDDKKFDKIKKSVEVKEVKKEEPDKTPKKK